MGMHKVESVYGRSIEAGADGRDGISRAEAHRVPNYIEEDEMASVREALARVPGNDDIVKLREDSYMYSMSMTGMAEEIVMGQNPPSPSDLEYADETLEELEQAGKENADYWAEIERLS